MDVPELGPPSEAQADVPAPEAPSDYVAVLLYESSSTAPGAGPLYEESFVLIRAVCEDEARAKAHAHGQAQATRYRNERGDLIAWRLRRVVDVAPVLDDALGDGAQLYARHFRNHAAYQAFEPLAGEAPP